MQLPAQPSVSEMLSQYAPNAPKTTSKTTATTHVGVAGRGASRGRVAVGTNSFQDDAARQRAALTWQSKQRMQQQHQPPHHQYYHR